MRLKLIRNKRVNRVWLWDEEKQKIVKRQCNDCLSNVDGCALCEGFDVYGCRFYMKGKNPREKKLNQ